MNIDDDGTSTTSLRHIGDNIMNIVLLCILCSFVITVMMCLLYWGRRRQIDDERKTDPLSDLGNVADEV